MKRVLFVSLLLSGALTAGVLTTVAAPAGSVTVLAGACGHCGS